MIDYDAPQIARTEERDGYTVRLRAKAAYTQKEGWHPADITVEYVGPPDALPATLFQDGTIDLHAELSEACQIMNAREGR